MESSKKHRTIFKHGEGYLHSAMKLQQGLSDPPDPEKGEQFHIITSTMIARTALELFLKAMYHLNLESAPPETCSFREMVADLPKQIKTRLREKYNEYLDQETVKQFEKKTGTEVVTDFDEALDEHQKIFDQVRTIYDRSDSIQMPTLFAMIQAFKKVYEELT